MGKERERERGIHSKGGIVVGLIVMIYTPPDDDDECYTLSCTRSHTTLCNIPKRLTIDPTMPRSRQMFSSLENKKVGLHIMHDGVYWIWIRLL